MDPNKPSDEREDLPEESTEKGPYSYPSDDQQPDVANDDSDSDDFEDVDGDLETDSEPNPDGQR